MTPAQLYSAMLLTYPPSFRREYGARMIETFTELYEANTGSSVAFWIFVAADTCRSAFRLWLDVCGSGSKRFAIRWAVACAAGTIVTALLGNALTYSFRYLYHPYLEGLALGPWSYGALLGLGLGVVQACAFRGSLRLGITWVLASTVGAAVGLHTAVALAAVAGPVGYGIVLGGFVGGIQWLFLRSRVRQAAWLVVTSVAALSLAVASLATAMRASLGGVNPIAGAPSVIEPQAYRAALAFLTRGLNDPTGAHDLAVELGVMALSGLIIAALTARPLSIRARGQSC